VIYPAINIPNTIVYFITFVGKYSTLNTELFIAKRIQKQTRKEKAISRPIIGIAVLGISLGLAVMILSVAIATGFKEEIRNKTVNFGSHIQLVHFDSNQSYEMAPIERNRLIRTEIEEMEGIRHIQSFALKAGIVKTRENMQGIVLKGIDVEYDWSYFSSVIKKGEAFRVDDSTSSNQIVISESLSKALSLDTNDRVRIYFVQNPPRARVFEIAGIYNTGLTDFDDKFAFIDLKHIQALNDWSPNQISGYEIFIDDFEQLDKLTSDIRDISTMMLKPDVKPYKVINIKQKYYQTFSWLRVLDMNVWIILSLIILVASINMISGLLILILERTPMIGVLKALGSRNWSVRKIFLYQASYLIAKGLIWGNAIGLGIALVQEKFKLLRLDPESYYLDSIPINLELWHVLALNAGTLGIVLLILLIPSYIITRISPEKTIRFD
jgi:lipoprotein-releasing system permease protein